MQHTSLPGGTRRAVAFCFSLALGASIIAAPSLHAQGAPPARTGASHDMEEEHHSGAWKEMAAFHDVMSGAWHPAMNDSLAPARATAGKLVDAARRWAGSAVPMGCDGAEVKAAIARLVPESEVVVSLVTRKADDAALKAALKTVHDTFHVVEEQCKPMNHAPGVH